TVIVDRVGAQLPLLPLPVFTLGDVERPLVWGDEEPVGARRVERRPMDRPAVLTRRIEPEDGFVVQLHVGPELAVARIGEPDAAPAVDRQIVRAVQPATFEAIGQHGYSSVCLVADHAASPTLAGIEPAVAIEHQPIGFLRPRPELGAGTRARIVAPDAAGRD